MSVKILGPEEQYIKNMKGKTKNQLWAVIMRLRKEATRMESDKEYVWRELKDTRTYADRMAREKEQEAKNHEVELETLERMRDQKEAKLNGEIAGLRDAIRIISGSK